MKRTIWKFAINPDAKLDTLSMPAGAQILHVETQGQCPCLWAWVDPDAKPEKRRFRVVGTGWDFDPTGLTHVGTFLLDGGALVFHLFEVYTGAAERAS